jgi:hypothetical protein
MDEPNNESRDACCSRLQNQIRNVQTRAYIYVCGESERVLKISEIYLKHFG